MALQLHSVFPNIIGESQLGPFNLYEFLGDSWGLLCSHPNDFTPVCTTEVGQIAQMEPEFTARNVKVMGISCNTSESHAAWVADILAATGGNVTYPLISDPTREHVTALGMLDETNRNNEGLPMTVRSVYVIGADKTVKLVLMYPAACGRNYNEVLRAIDSLQLATTAPIATPHGWTPGSEVMVMPCVSPEEAAAMPGFRVQELPSGKQYMRFAAQPQPQA